MSRLRGCRGTDALLDLGVGSGCILLSALAERSDASGVGVDISAAALEVARVNASALGVAVRAEMIEGGWRCRVAGTVRSRAVEPALHSGGGNGRAGAGGG